MKKISFVLFIMFLLNFSVFAQEQSPSPQPAKPADKIVDFPKGDFTVKIKTDSRVASNPDLDILGKMIIARLQEKVDNGSITAGCNLFFSISPVVKNKETGELKKILTVGAGTRDDFQPTSLSTMSNSPIPPFTEKERIENLDKALSQLSFTCSPPKQ
jgi:hypothetical protein